MSTANTHPGLNFNLPGARRYQPPPAHAGSSNKTVPSLSSSLAQHALPYQPQSYTQQQPPQGTYPSHLFSTPPPQVSGVNGNQNGPRQPPQHQAPPALPGSRQRAPPSRQMQTQANQSLSYLHQALNPPPLNPQQLSQQSLSQPAISQPSLAQQSLSQQQGGQQSLGQQQTLSQMHPGQHPGQHQSQHQNQQPLNPQQLSQQSLNQHSLNQQSLNQQPLPQQPLTHQSSGSQSAKQNDNSILSQQSTPHSQSQPTLPPVSSQVPHMQKLVQQVQQALQQPAVPQSEPVQPVHQTQHQDEDMDMASQDESGEGDMTLEPKLVDGAAYVGRSPKGPMMSAPPEGGSFPTLEAVHKHVLEYCTSVGYAIVIGRSKKTVPGLKKVLFVCDRAGKPPKRVSPEMRKRKTSSRKCDCQFGFFAIEQRTQWTVRYRPDPEHLKHNHGPSDSPLHHPAARKLDSKMVAAVKALKDNGTLSLHARSSLSSHQRLCLYPLENVTDWIDRRGGESDFGDIAAR